jgi:hypothetical protein
LFLSSKPSLPIVVSFPSFEDPTLSFRSPMRSSTSFLDVSSTSC